MKFKIVRSIILFSVVLYVISLSSCISPEGQNSTKTSDNYSIKVIDSCEYIEFDYGIFDQRVYSLTHKGNCKFCTERNTHKY